MNNRLNGFTLPEAASRYGVAEGRPAEKRIQELESYRRIINDILMGVDAKEPLKNILTA